MSYLDPRRTPGLPSLIFAVVFPAAVILIELLSGLCADTFFDPLPTFGPPSRLGSAADEFPPLADGTP